MVDAVLPTNSANISELKKNALLSVTWKEFNMSAKKKLIKRKKERKKERICTWLNSRGMVFVAKIASTATISAGMKNDYKAVFCVATAILVWNGRRSCGAYFFRFVKKML